MRTDPATFNLPVEKIRSGYYSDQYFNYTKGVLEGLTPSARPVVTMQVFQKNEAVLGGIDEALAILRLCSGEGLRQESMSPLSWEFGWPQLEVYALNEGDDIAPFEPVMHIVGPYHLFAHLETVYLGTLARRTLIGTNVRRVIKAAGGKPVMYFPARHDHWQVQTGDGFVAHTAGVEGVSTDAQANWWGGKGMGTVPHGLIAAFGGDTVAAARSFAAKYGGDTNVSVLVDFHNNCAHTAVEVANAAKAEGWSLYGVRLDTSETLVDEGIVPRMGQFKPTGVNPELVRHVREVLDHWGHHDTKIIVSGGFDVAKIERFEREGVPADVYGVGASLIRGANDFTADVVRIRDGEGWDDCGKVGRVFMESARLERVM